MRIGIVDTTFARVDMARHAIEEIQKNVPKAQILRITVPGFKNTPWAARKLIVENECDGILVLGWIGKSLTDKLTYAVTSMGLVLLQIEYGKPIVDVTVHEDESEDPKELYNIAIDRARKHAVNLVKLIRGEDLSKYAGKGLRQGRPDVGPLFEDIGDRYIEW